MPDTANFLMTQIICMGSKVNPVQFLCIFAYTNPCMDRLEMSCVWTKGVNNVEQKIVSMCLPVSPSSFVQFRSLCLLQWFDTCDGVPSVLIGESGAAQRWVGMACVVRQTASIDMANKGEAGVRGFLLLLFFSFCRLFGLVVFGLVSQSGLYWSSFF